MLHNLPIALSGGSNESGENWTFFYVRVRAVPDQASRWPFEARRNRSSATTPSPPLPHHSPTTPHHHPNLSSTHSIERAPLSTMRQNNLLLLLSSSASLALAAVPRGVSPEGTLLSSSSSSSSSPEIQLTTPNRRKTLRHLPRKHLHVSHAPLHLHRPLQDQRRLLRLSRRLRRARHLRVLAPPPQKHRDPRLLLPQRETHCHVPPAVARERRNLRP